MSANDQPESRSHVLGPTHGNTSRTATFETKPATYSNGRWNSGSGYEHWRSTEFRPHTPRGSSESVYASHHRLLAVVACYPMSMPIEDVLDDLRGSDVHHNCPDVDDDWGIPWDNRHDCLEVLGHGEHSSITQAQQRAWAEDAKRKGVSEALPQGSKGSERCRRCDETEGPLATSEGFDGTLCIQCATDESDGEPINVL